MEDRIWIIEVPHSTQDKMHIVRDEKQAEECYQSCLNCHEIAYFWELTGDLNS